MSDHFDFAPLEAHVVGSGPRLSAGVLAAELGVVRRTIVRWRTVGLTWVHADRAAVRLGVHPSAIWPSEWWAAANEEAAA